MLSIDNIEVLDYQLRPNNKLDASLSFVYDTVGYTTVPTISFSGGGGSGAAATAVLTNGRISAINVTNGGSSYATAPTVTISGTGGATATATVAGGVVTGVTITNNGTKNTIVVTDATSYPAGDSRKIVDIEVYDRFGGKVFGHIDTNTAGNKVQLDVAALNPARGFAMNVKVVSTKGLVKDGSVFKIANTFNSGAVTMEK